mmetsp:Transcript_15741/g.23036  ORF Transcript_15741/g.23036 Transcript_15741/m.23036 type:complete len:208 (-) Transcript_15741:143-766(-)
MVFHCKPFSRLLGRAARLCWRYATHTTMFSDATQRHRGSRQATDTMGLGRRFYSRLIRTSLFTNGPMRTPSFSSVPLTTSPLGEGVISDCGLILSSTQGQLGGPKHLTMSLSQSTEISDALRSRLGLSGQSHSCKMRRRRQNADKRREGGPKFRGRSFAADVLDTTGVRELPCKVRPAAGTRTGPSSCNRGSCHPKTTSFRAIHVVC